MPTLSPRQEQILVLLNKGMSAREIGDELGVTRNAIYQQITNLRKLGALSSEYTPSGEPARMAPSKQALAIVSELSPTSSPALLSLVEELTRTERDLRQIANRIAGMLGTSQN